MGKKENKRILSLLLAGVLLLQSKTAVFAEEAKTNVLSEKNTGFEAADEAGVPYWWYASSAVISQNSEVTDIPEGNSCVKVEPNGGGNWIGCAMNVDGCMEEGKEYGYSFSARLADEGRDDAKVSLILNQIYKDDFSDTQLVEASVDNEVTFQADAWTTVTGSFSINVAEGKELKQLHIVLSSGDTAVPFYADNLIIYEKGQADTPVLSGDNLIQNPEFSNGTEGWYATGGTLDCVTEENGNVYAQITGRTENWNCIAQNVASVVENHTDYAFSFDVRLTGDYAEARIVQLCTTKKDSNDESEVYDRLTVKGGSATVVPGEWTKIEGTLSVAYTGTLEKLEFKISEQGDPITEGSYGSYEVDNVKMYAVEKEPISIEMDIKDLKEQFAEDFGGKAGVAIPYGALADEARMTLVTKHYNSVTAENEMKPDSFLGQTPNIGEDGYPILNFTTADAMLDYLLAHNAANPEDIIQVRGHVLVWHSQTPEWFFHEGYDASAPYVTPEVMSARLENYIAKVLEHYHGEESPYKGLIYAWDVVNEAVNDSDGGLRTESSWYNVYGSSEFIIKAFTYANRYAPADVKLFYNDYNETSPQKCVGICNLLKEIKVADGTRIDGMGMQGHYNMDSPSMGQFEHAIRSYAAIVEEVQITELDMKSSNDYDGSNKDAEYTKQAYRYKDFFDRIISLKAEGIAITSVTLWGTHDAASWLQSSNSVGGSSDGSRPQCPLFFDDNLKAKPAYWALVDPSKLEPSIQNITVMQMQNGNLDAVDSISFTRNGTEVSFKTAWNEQGMVVQVTVLDDTNTAEDAVTIYTDLANTASAGADIESSTITRKEATVTEGGYQVKFAIPMTVTVGKKIGFDIAVNNDGETVSFNDLKNSQNMGSNYYALAIFKPYTEIAKGTVTIDAQADAIWENVMAVPLQITTGTVAASANVKLLWDEEMLYVYAEVTDPVLNADSADDYQQDSLEVFIDENNHKTEAYEADDKQYRVNYQNKQSFNGSECKAEYMKSATTQTETGYVIEASYEWTEIVPQVGDEIGLELQINEAGASGSRIGTLSWFDETGMGWSAPSVFGTACLADAIKDADSETNPSTPGEGDEGTTPPTPGTNPTTPEPTPTVPGNDPTTPEPTPTVPGSNQTTPGTDMGNAETTRPGNQTATGNTASAISKAVTEEVIAVGDARMRVLKSNKMTGVSVQGAEGVIPAGADFNVQVLHTTSEAYVKATAAVLQHIPTQYGYAVYELDLLDASGTKMHALNGEVVVQLPIPEGLTLSTGQTIGVYRLKDDGTLTKCAAETKDGTVTFRTNHFSTYIFAIEKQASVPNTSDSNTVAISVILLCIAFCMVAAGVYGRGKYARIRK